MVCGLWIALWSVGRAQSKVLTPAGVPQASPGTQGAVGAGVHYAVSQRATITAKACLKEWAHGSDPQVAPAQVCLAPGCAEGTGSTPGRCILRATSTKGPLRDPDPVSPLWVNLGPG